MGPGRGPARLRPHRIEVAAAILVVGGLVGYSQLAAGDYVVTGSLPAKGPIIGVAAIAYGASIALGALVWARRGWLAGLNFAILVGVVYLAAFPRPFAVTMGLAHLIAAVSLATSRSWFAAGAGRTGG